VDAQCDKLVMIVDRTKVTASATVYVPWRKFYNYFSPHCAVTWFSTLHCHFSQQSTT